MNPTWHILISHSPKLIVLAIAGWGHFMSYRRKQAAKNKTLRPPQSSPAAPSMTPQQMSNTTKKDSSPWSNADPFNSQRPRR